VFVERLRAYAASYEGLQKIRSAREARAEDVQLAEGPERALEQLCEQVNRFIKRHITEVETLLVLVDGLDEAVHLKGVESENVVRLTGLLAERMYAEAVSVLVSTQSMSLVEEALGTGGLKAVELEYASVGEMEQAVELMMEGEAREWAC
jgi:hypothetical protein